MSIFQTSTTKYTGFPDIREVPIDATSNRLTPQQMAGGVSRGAQFVGSSTLQIDSASNLIMIKKSDALSLSVLRIGQVATGFLGMAVSDGLLDTLFAGLDDNGNTVVKIAKPGFDAKTTASTNLVFNSSQNILKVVSSGSISLNTNGLTDGSFKTAIIAHGLTVTPLVQGYMSGNGSQTFLVSGQQYQLPYSATFNGIEFGIRVDTTNVTFYCKNQTGLDFANLIGTVQIKYYIFQESAV